MDQDTPRYPTLSDISRLSGFSVSTVSRALRGESRVSRQTIGAVQSIAKQLGYEPDALARGLVTGQRTIIGCAFSERPAYVVQENFNVLAKLAAARGQQLMIFQVPGDGSLLEVMPTMLSYRLGGCIAMQSVKVPDKAVDTLARYQIPLVMIDQPASHPSASAVTFNHREGARRLGDLLIAGQHRRIAFVAGLPSWRAKERELGLRDSLAQARQKLFARFDGDNTFEGGYSLAQAILSRKQRPDAIFAGIDLMAFGIMDASRKQGLKIPADISVVGFGDSNASSWPSYDLTTARLPFEILFSRALDLLALRRREGAFVSENISVGVSVITRSSCRRGASVMAADQPYRASP